MLPFKNLSAGMGRAGSRPLVEGLTLARSIDEPLRVTRDRQARGHRAGVCTEVVVMQEAKASTESEERVGSA